MAAPFDGFTFVFTGDMRIPREDARSSVILLGARVTTAISGKTTHLVVGNEPGPSKLEKAKENRITILSEDSFFKLLEAAKKSVGPAPPPLAISSDCSLKDSLPWAEKYRPATKDEFVGNKQVISQLESYLKTKPSGKAALLSGPPGIGKTSAALLVSKSCGFLPVEFNASDVRNKKAVSENIGSLINTSVVVRRDKPRVIIMDEVDGMTSDRGGIPELVRIIKQSRTPIICICNDRMHIKMRTLGNYCLDLRFRRPDSTAILKRAKEVLKKEGKTLDDGVINDIISKSSGDLRFVMNGLQAASNSHSGTGILKKTVSKSIFEVASEMFHRGSLVSKMDLFFEEYDMLPLFVHENYPKCDITDFMRVADSISFSDTVDSHIHGPEQDWSLLPHLGFYGCVYPTKNSKLTSRIDFPSFLGQNSRRLRFQRVTETLTRHCREKMAQEEMRLYGMDIFTERYLSALKEGDVKGALDVLINYDFTKEDMQSMIEMIADEEYKKIPTKTKTACSREYNKIKRVLPYNTVQEVIEEEED